MMERKIGLFGTLLAALLALYAVTTTGYWKGAERAFSDDGRSYEERRIAYGFAGIPVESIGERLTYLLSISTPISLSARLLVDDFAKQRLSEALYPRVIDIKSSYQLDVLDRQSFEHAHKTGQAPGIMMAQVGENIIYLRGVSTISGTRGVVNQTFDFSWGIFLGALFAALGYGMLVWTLILRRWISVVPSLLPALFLIFGAVLNGVLLTLASWLQIRFVFEYATILGIIACALILGSILVRTWRLGTLASSVKNQFLRAWFGRPENYVLAALLAVFFTRVALFPIALWDGRSVWFFQAKRLFFDGMVTHENLLHPDLFWALPDKPLLFSAWIAHFTGLSEIYNERMASLGIPVLLSAIIILLWPLMRSLVGRWMGAAMVLVAFFSIETLAAGGYVDGFVMFSLIVTFVGFSQPQYRAIGWIGAIIAAMLKLEGLVFSLMTVVAFIAFHPSKDEKSRSWLKQLAPLGFFLLPLSHALWSKMLGFPGAFGGIRWNELFEDFFERWGVLFEAIPALMGKNPILWAGLGGLIVSTLALGFFRKKTRLAIVAIGLAAAYFIFAAVTLFLTPHNLRWHVSTAMDRLMFHPAALLVLSPLLFFAAPLSIDAVAHER